MRRDAIGLGLGYFVGALYLAWLWTSGYGHAPWATPVAFALTFSATIAALQVIE